MNRVVIYAAALAWLVSTPAFGLRLSTGTIDERVVLEGEHVGFGEWQYPVLALAANPRHRVAKHPKKAASAVEAASQASPDRPMSPPDSRDKPVLQ